MKANRTAILWKLFKSIEQTNHELYLFNEHEQPKFLTTLHTQSSPPIMKKFSRSSSCYVDLRRESIEAKCHISIATNRSSIYINGVLKMKNSIVVKQIEG